MKSPIFLLTLLALSTPLLAQETVVTALLTNGSATVTLRTGGGLQVSETRRVNLVAGANRVALPGLAPQLIPASLQTRFTGPGNVEVTEQSTRLDSGSPDTRAVLKRYLGKTVTLLRFISGTAGEKATTGTLLQVDDTILLDTPEGVLVGPTGTFLVPRGDSATGAPRAVVLGVAATSPGDYRVESNYLVAEGSWNANYRASLSAAGNQLDLSGFAFLQIPGNLEYSAAQIVLHPQKNDGTLQPLLMRPVDLTRGNSQISFFDKTIAVSQRNVYRATGEFTANSEGAPRLVLRSLSPVGADLPSGALALYRERPIGPPEAITATLAATPADSILQIALGEVPGVKVTRRIVKTRQLSPVTTEYTVEFTLTNSSKVAQPIEIIEDLPVNPTVGEANPQPVVDEKARTLSYAVTVAPEGSLVLRYVVESKTG